MKTTSATANGTSFFGSTITSTPAQLKAILGKPTYNFNDGLDKVNLEWVIENDNGDVFTVYDWKTGHGISDDAVIEWHIGGYNAEVTNTARRDLGFALLNNKNIIDI